MDVFRFRDGHFGAWRIVAALTMFTPSVAAAGAWDGPSAGAREFVVPERAALSASDGPEGTREEPGEHEHERLDPAEQAGLEEPSEAAETAAENAIDKRASDTGGRGNDGPLEIAHDAQDRAFRAGEIVLIASRTDADKISHMGAAVIERRRLTGLGDLLVRIALPLSADPVAFEAKLARTAPGAVSDLDHLYGVAGRPTAGSPSLSASPNTETHGHGLVGIVDGPVDRSTAQLGRMVVEARSFAPNPPASLRHGPVVAYLAASSGARVLAANVFSRAPGGGEAASVDAMARAMDWLVARGAPVINMSVEGPPNRVLADLVRRAQARGCVVVAAAGNGGPAAPPAYPAAYPSVVAVTAVDASGAVYRYANRGDYITFAALGVNVRTPVSTTELSGTSYAAPVVAGLVAHRLHRQDRHEAAAVIEGLKRQARHVGGPGRDPVYGYGLLAP